MTRHSRASADTLYIGVIGPGEDAAEQHRQLAHMVGLLIAQSRGIVVTGGLGGVMAAACEGAREASGQTIGLLPGDRRSDGNDHLSIAIPTGLGELRNGLVVRASDAIISIGGSWGTLSEVALAIRTGVPVVALHGWELPEPAIIRADSPEDAVRRVLDEAAVRVQRLD